MSLLDFLAAGGYVETERVRRDLPYDGADLAQLAKTFALPSLMQQPPVLSRPHSSIGWVTIWPTRSFADLQAWFDKDPYAPFMFAGGFGDDAEYYIANTIRKWWALVLGDGSETLELMRRGFDFPYPAEKFVMVHSVRRYPVGTFGFGGAVPVMLDGALSGGAVSVLDQNDDPIGGYMVARYVLSAVAQRVDPEVDLVDEFDQLRKELVGA